MASPSSEKRGELPPSEHIAGELPRDALYDILLRLPAKDVCRLRAVSPSWRSLTLDPIFVKAHAARHPGPLLATTFADGESRGVSIVDLLSGDVIKRIRTSGPDLRVPRTRLDRVCLVGGRHPMGVPVTLLDPATGAVISSWQVISMKYAGLLKTRKAYMDSCVFGKVPSTGVYKAFRFLEVRPLVSPQQLCEVMTLNGRSAGRWRARPGPPGRVFSDHTMKSAAIDGVLYFLMDFSNMYHSKVTIKPASIAAFNLKTEEWMPPIDGPGQVSSLYDEEDVLPVFEDPRAVAQVRHSLPQSMDLWFLMDREKGVWVKKYSIGYYRREDHFSYPLLVLDDERIVFVMQLTGLLQVYDPKTETYTDLWQLEDFKSMCIYTGNLLSQEATGFHC
nr:putative F-box protein At1g47765 isoform X2 [Aegilops tauschii subsp. strangulata]